jgi:hypothetical protein
MGYSNTGGPGRPGQNAPPASNGITAALVGVAEVLLIAVTALGLMLFRKGTGSGQGSLPAQPGTSAPASPGATPSTAAQVATRQFLQAVRAAASDLVTSEAESDIAQSHIDTARRMGQLLDINSPDFAAQRAAMDKREVALQKLIQLAKVQTVAPALRDCAIGTALSIDRGSIPAQDGLAERDRMLGGS